MTMTMHGATATWTDFDAGEPERLVEPLTPKELQILRAIVTGRTLAEVGTSLGVSRNTVHFHVKNIYDKLGVSTRVQVTLRAQRLGLLSR